MAMTLGRAQSEKGQEIPEDLTGDKENYVSMEIIEQNNKLMNLLRKEVYNILLLDKCLLINIINKKLTIY